MSLQIAAAATRKVEGALDASHCLWAERRSPGAVGWGRRQRRRAADASALARDELGVERPSGRRGGLRRCATRAALAGSARERLAAWSGGEHVRDTARPGAHATGSRTWTSPLRSATLERPDWCFSRLGRGGAELLAAGAKPASRGAFGGGTSVVGGVEHAATDSAARRPRHAPVDGMDRIETTSLTSPLGRLLRTEPSAGSRRRADAGISRSRRVFDGAMVAHARRAARRDTGARRAVEGLHACPGRAS